MRLEALAEGFFGRTVPLPWPASSSFQSSGTIDGIGYFVRTQPGSERFRAVVVAAERPQPTERDPLPCQAVRRRPRCERSFCMLGTTAIPPPTGDARPVPHELDITGAGPRSHDDRDQSDAPAPPPMSITWIDVCSRAADASAWSLVMNGSPRRSAKAMNRASAMVKFWRSSQARELSGMTG